MPDFQILLLPKDNYWDWVRAAHDYALKYGVNLTSDPDSAGRFRMPDQVVTIALAPNAFPAQGDILDWFRRSYPSVRVDPIKVNTPADFTQALAARISAGDRFGQAGKSFSLAWPTDYPVVTQPFNVNPDVYRRFGLPGHEGLDIRAPMNSNVYAGEDGTVFMINEDPGKHAYGIHVRLQHRDGYQTVYGHLARHQVSLNQQVKRGQKIGDADSTGNSIGSHLHLTLKKQGATAAGLTAFPGDIIDPTPFMVWPGDQALPPAIQYPWPAGKCLVGVHGRADGPLLDPDYNAIQTARVEAVKLTTSARPENVDRLRQINPNMFIMVRLFADFRNRTVRPDEFASWVEGDMAQFYSRGLRYFEVHNEVNLQIE
ncbi:MAG: M23 family metallopeptidase, partial [Chloroflexi bacterium]|nr:M23 family metallopeptidase [Chloroflexota bacterium]